MKNLHIIKNDINYYTFDHGNDSAAGNVEVTMRLTAFGWNIEVTELEHWDRSEDTTFFWVANTAREAFNDCMHCLRYIERRRRIKRA